MFLSGTLGSFLLALLSLFLSQTEAQGVDHNALARIISKIQKEYSPNGNNQYAVAINVPVRYCSAGSNPDDGDFLKDDTADAAIRAMNGANRVYEGQELIGAMPKYVEHKKFELHSEYLLLRDPDEDHSLMKNLLNKKKGGCVIFYTYNSPCTGACLREDGNRQILDALQLVEDHKGPKAFVYNRIFRHDIENYDLEEYLKKINNEVQLYRCYPARKITPNRNRDHSSRPSRTRSPLPGQSKTSRDRSRSRSPVASRSSDSDAYECDRCFNSEIIEETCIDTNV